MVKISHDPTWQTKMHEYPAGTGSKHHLYQPHSHQNENCEPGGRNSDKLNTDDHTPMDMLKTNRNLSKSVQPQVTKLTEEIIENTFMKIGTDLNYSFSSLKDASDGSCTFVRENHSNEAAPQVKSPSEMTEKDRISYLDVSCENLVSDTSVTNSPCSTTSYQQKISQTILKAVFRREKYMGEESSTCLNMVHDVLHQLIERIITDLGTLPLSLPYFIKGTMHDMPYSSVTQLNIMSCINILMMESKSEVRLVANAIIEIVLEKVYSHILLKVQQEEAAPMEMQIPHIAKFYLKSSDLVDGQNENSYFITNNKPYLRTGNSEVLTRKENGQPSSSAVTKELVQQVGDKFESFVKSRLHQISVSEPDFKYGAINELTSFGKRNSKIKETVLPKIKMSNPLLIFPSFTSTKDPKILLSRIYVSKSVLEVYAKYVLHDIFQLIQTELKLETYRRTALRGDMLPLANITTATNTVESLLSDFHYERKKMYFSPIDQFIFPRHQSCGATCTPLIHKPKRTTETPLTVLNVDDVNIFSKRDNDNARLPSQIRNSSWKPQKATNLKADRKLKSTQKPIDKIHISKERAIHEETINYLPDISNTSLVPKSVFKTPAERKVKDPLLQYFEQKAERPDSETSTEMTASSESFIAFKMKGKTQTYKTDIKVNSLEGKNGKEEAMMLKSSKLDTFIKPEVSSCALDRICVKTPPGNPDNVSQLKPDSDTSLKARTPIIHAVPNSHHNSRQQNTTAHNQFDHMNNLFSKYGILAVSDKSQSVQITDKYQQRQLELGTLANTTFLPQNKSMCTPTTKHAFNNKFNSQREMSPTMKKYSDPLAVKLSVQNSTHKNQCSTGKKDKTLKTNAIHQDPCFKYIPITYSHADPIYGNIANLNSVSSLHTACGLESKVSEVMIPQVSNVVSHSFPPGELECSIIKPKESEKAISQSSTDKSTADVKNIAVSQNTIHKSSYIDQQMSPSSLHLLNAVPKKVVPGVFEKCLPASSFHTNASICDEGLQMSLKESKSYDIGQSEGNEFFEGMRMCENEKYIQIMVEQIHSPKMKYSLSYDVDFRNKSVKPNSFSPVSNESTLDSSNNLSKSVNGPVLLNTEQSGMIQQTSIRDPSHVENPTESISEKQYPQTASSILPFAELKQVLSTSAETGRYMHPVDCMTSKTICVPIPKPTALTSSSFQQEQWKQKIDRKVSTHLSAHKIRQKHHKSYDKRQTPDDNEFYEGNNMCEKEKYIQIMVEQIHSPKMKHSLSYDVDFRNKSVKPSPVSNESTLDSSNSLPKSVNGLVFPNTEQPGMIQQPSIRDPSHVEKPTESISEKQYSQTASSNLPFAELKQVLSTSAETGRHMPPVDCVTSKTICVPIPKPTELTSSSFQQEQWKQKIGRKLSTNLSAHKIRQKDHKSYDKRQTPDGNEFFEGNNMCENEKYIQIMVEELHSPKMKYSLSYDVDFRNKSVKPNSFSPVSNESTLDSSNNLSKSVNGPVLLNTEQSGTIQQTSIRDPSHVEKPTESRSKKQYSQTASSILPFAELKQVLSTSAETGRYMHPVDCMTSKTICVPIPKPTALTSSSFQQEQWKQKIDRKVSTHLSAHKIRQKHHKSYDKRQTADDNEFYEGNNMCEKEKYIQIMVEQIHSPKMKYSLSYDVDFRNKSVKPSPVSNESTLDSSNSLPKSVNGLVFPNTEQPGMIQQPSIRDPSHVEKPTESISEKQYSQTASSNLPFAELKQVLSTSAEAGRHMPPVDCVTSKTICVPIPKPTELTSSSFQQEQWKQKIGRKLSTNLSAHKIRQKDHKSYDKRQTPDGNEFFEGNNMCENEKYIQILVEQLHSPKMKYSLSYDVDFRNKSVKPNSFSPVSNESTLDSSNNLSTSVNGPVLLNTEQPGMIQQPSIRDPSHVEKPTESRSKKQYSQTASSILPFAELKQVLSTSAETGRHMLPVDCVTSKTICVPIPKPTELTSSSFQQEQWKQKIGRKLSTNLSAHTIRQKDHKSYDNQQTPDGNEFYEGNNMWEKEKYIHIMVEQIHSPKMKYSLSYDVDFRNKSVKPNSFSPVSNESTLDSSNSLPKSVNGLVFPNTEQAGMIQQPSIRDPSHVENPTDSISEKQYSQTASSNLPFAELKQVLSTSAETGRYMHPVDCVTSKTICVPIPKPTELTSSSFQQEQWKQEIGRKVSTNLSAHKIRQKDHKSYDKRPDGNDFYEGNNMCENEKYIQIMVEQLHSPKMKYSLSYDVTSSKKSLAGNSFSPVANDLEVDSSHSMSTSVKDVVFLNTEETRITKQSSIGDPSYVKNPSQSISEEFPQIASANMPMKTATLKQVLPTSAETRRHMPSVDFVTLENKCVPKTIYAYSSNIQQGQRKDGISTILPRDLTELESSRKKSDNVVEQMINGKSVSSWFSKSELMKATYDQHEACPNNLFTTVQSDNIYHKDQCDKSFLNERHSFTGVYPDSFLEDILSGLLSKILFVSSINAMRERVGEPYEGELCEVALKCLNSMLAYLTTLQIKIVKADEIIQCFPPIENFDIDEAVHSIYCNVLQAYGSQQAVYTTLINDSDMFAERIIKLVLKHIYNCALKSSVSEKFISYPCTMLEAGNIIQKVIHNVHRPGNPWQALSLHSTLLFATTCLEDIITNLISDIFSPSANSATHPGNQTVLSETEFSAISAQLRHKVLQNISKNKACNTNNSNMKHYLQTELDIQKVVESVHSAVLHVYKSPKAIQTALVSTNGTILEIIAKTIILEVTHYLQPFYSGEITHTPRTSSAENTVMMLPKTKHCPPGGQSNKLSFGVYTASFLEDVISGLISKIFFTSNGHAEDKNISECDLSEIVLNCVNCLIRDLTKYPIEVVTITEETLDDAPNKNDVSRVVDSLFHNVLKEFGSHQAIEHDLSNNIFFAQRINCLLLAEIVDYQVQPSHSLELSHHQYTTLEANNIVHKIENYVKKTRDQDTPCSSLTTKLSSEFIEDIVIRLISKIFTADGNKYKGNQSLVSDSEFKDMISTFLCDLMSEISNCDIKDTWGETYVRYSQKDILNVVDLLYNKMLTKYGTQLAAQDKIRNGSKTAVKGIARYLIKVICSPKFVAVSNGESSSSSNVSSSMSSGVEHDQCCLDVSQDASKVTAHTTVYSSSLVEEVISGSLSNTTEFVSKNSFMKELKPEIGKVALKDLKTKQELLVGSVLHDIEHPDTDLAADHSIEGDLKGASCLMDSNNELQLEKQHPRDGQSVKNKRSSIARMKRFIKVHFHFKGRHSTKTLDSQKDLHRPDTNQEQGGAVSYFMKHNSGPKYDSSRQNDILDPDNLKYSNQSKESIPSGLKSNATRPNSEGQTLLNISSGSFAQDSAMNTEMPHTHPPPMSSSIQSRPSSRSVRKRWHQLLWSRVKCFQCTRPEVETETEEHQYNSTTEETNSTQQIPQDIAESSASVSPAEKLPLSTRASLAKLVFQKKISRIPTKDEKNESVPSKTKM